jgi:uncharacterized repeat protein (TIGR03847 family)
MAESASVRFDLGDCRILEPEYVGAPGQRTFRLRARGEHGSAVLWLEKEELYQLAVTIKQLLRSSVRPTGAPVASADIETAADHEFKVVGLSLGHDRRSQRYVLIAQASDDEDDAVALWAPTPLLDRMADRAFEVHDGGRPRCALCGRSTGADGVHSCPRAN